MDEKSSKRPLPYAVAVGLVTITSAGVLILEILATRLMAPYVGANLETYTAIIGTILAGIAIGAWAGGVAADRNDPRRLIPLLLVVGGALAIASIPIVRVLGGEAGAATIGTPSLILAAAGFLPAAGVLSAIPPAVIKLQLRNLDETGSTVGSLSAWGTGGAIVGTFLAGFVLVAFAAVTTLIIAVGGLMIVGGVIFHFTAPVDWGDDEIDQRYGVARSKVHSSQLQASGFLLVLAVVGLVLTDDPCDVQTSYYCVAVEVDAERDSGRILVLDDLRHSYVDLEDPTYLEFWYIKMIVEVINAEAPAGAIDLVALGGGGFTVPRYVRATRPGSDQTVLEIDPQLVEIVSSDLDLVEQTYAGTIAVRSGDGRVNLRQIDVDSADVIVGDAFGSRAVPWHLATVEFMQDMARVLRPGGIYVANIIDGPEHEFLSAEARTVQTVLPYIAIIEGPSLVEGYRGNAVLVASDEPLDLKTINTDGGRLIVDAVEIADYLDGAQLLTDDFAPVDQLIFNS